MRWQGCGATAPVMIRDGCLVDVTVMLADGGEAIGGPAGSAGAVRV
jgi:hypothetical protein